MPPPDSLVQIRKITKDYRSLRPLRIESLDLQAGQTLALCGFDSMTAEILVDLITAAIVPDSGEIRVFGQLTTAIADRESWLQTLDRFGLLTERAVLVEQFTVEQNLAIPYSLSVEDLSADLKTRVAALADEIGFDRSDLRRQSGVLPPLAGRASQCDARSRGSRAFWRRSPAYRPRSRNVRTGADRGSRLRACRRRRGAGVAPRDGHTKVVIRVAPLVLVDSGLREGGSDGRRRGF
jgi:ABC-type thiamine transport system ATPase subunit